MASSEETQHPILAARPPASDYLTYLTIIEYNLTEESLPILEQVLEDTAITENIAWDLVSLLLPLLPASEHCLQQIGARGNPREVILKITEALRLLDFENPEDSSDGEGSKNEEQHAGPSTKTPGEGAPAYSSVAKYQALLSLLSTVHGRLKAKYPSRFFSTSLQAVLAAYSRAKLQMDEMTLATAKFIKSLSGSKRPQLPPRTSTGNLLGISSAPSQPDPESQEGDVLSDEAALCNRLLQAFLTHILEDYILSFSSEEDVPGLAWSSRLQEKYSPERRIPGKKTYAARFAEEEAFKTRSAVVGQLVAIAQDLGVQSDGLLQTIMNPESEEVGNSGNEDEPPSSAEDIPLSKTGSLFLFAARQVSEEIFGTTAAGSNPPLFIFPHHATLVKNFVGQLGIQSIGLDAEALLDAVLCLGIIAIVKNNIGEPKDDEQFEDHLRSLSLISANTASPSLRYHAHYLASTILRSHPSDLVRLSFIRSTLEDCPYENLKTSAVGWMKGETLEANTAPVTIAEKSGTDSPPGEAPSIFSTPVALSTIFPFMFPDIRESTVSKGDIWEAWTQFRLELGFYLAALNFYYLLLMAKPLHQPLDIPGLHEKGRIELSYIHPLREVIERFKGELAEGGDLREEPESAQSSLMDLMILEDVLDRVDQGIKALGK